MNADERETVINATDSDSHVRIWTAQPRYLGKLRRNPKFTETRHGRVDGTEWAEFTIPMDQWDPIRGAKPIRNLTIEQKSAAAARLAAVRAEKANR